MTIRTIALKAVVSLAASMSHLVSSNYVVDRAVALRYNYADYILLCKCLNKAPVSEHAYMSQAVEYQQLSLEGIV